MKKTSLRHLKNVILRKDILLSRDVECNLELIGGGGSNGCSLCEY